MAPVTAVPVMARRLYSTEQEDPKAKANAFIEAIPGSNYLSKTGIVATGTAAGIYAIANELFVLNEEALMLGTVVFILTCVGKFGGPAYSEFAKGYIDNVKKILNDARQAHAQSVKDRINDVSQFKDVVSTTEQLFAVSKETAKLESEAFELKQKVTTAHEIKAVLDSWVRYEASVRQREQGELAKSVIAAIEKEVQNSKFQKDYLAQSVADVEKLFAKA
ncbi:hypothetical protein CANCADRAFT_32808 [Tortispora caseinolytica NRRL Y-17796]|uniref:ATP synthase subunit 4 n=1 Tax=Tortispora caseinolytica NRRL Y-17796 TaxID=767744 RepID=A0A1E4TD18_9ASCO|nr:hypothetical protein CANCADRAFT_32808 [Tortispora caseinolytica NRRL Y-17796]